MTPIVLAIKQSGADIVSTYIANSTDVAIFAKQLRQLGLTVAWVGSPSVSTDTAMKLAGDALHGYNILKNDGGKIVFMKHIDFTPGE